MLHIFKMSLGFQREQDRMVPKKPPVKSAPKMSDIMPKISENIVIEPMNDKMVIQQEANKPFIPEWLFTILYTFLIVSSVSSLWIIASGLLWIKYYVECNQGMRTCE